MYRKDYILKMVEMLADLIAGILGLIKKGDFQEASRSLENAYTDFLKEDASLFRRVSKEALTDSFLRNHNYTNAHLEMVSELFYAEAELLLAKGKSDESLDFYEKALLLHEFIEKELKTFSMNRMSKISQIKQQINRIRN